VLWILFVLLSLSSMNKPIRPNCPGLVFPQSERLLLSGQRPVPARRGVVRAQVPLGFLNVDEAPQRKGSVCEIGFILGFSSLSTGLVRGDRLACFKGPSHNNLSKYKNYGMYFPYPNTKAAG